METEIVSDRLNDRLLHLKIKIKTLADESREIRREEQKLKARSQYLRLAARRVRRGVSDGTTGDAALRKFAREVSKLSESHKHRYISGLLQNKPISEEQLANMEMGAKRDNGMLVSIQGHRRGPLRQEARISQLAYAFLRGKQYNRTEHRPTTPALRDAQKQEIADMATRFGLRAVKKENIDDWAK